MNLRIGHGYDVHKFSAGRRMVLGGVKIDCPYGLEAHSDGDVLLHALSDALLGAGGMGDIGRHFPDSDERYKDADSTALLRECISIARIETVINADITVIAQQPRLAGYTERIRNSVASLLGCAPDRGNIKATTEEGLGFTGRKEGMAVHAVVLVILKENGK